MMIVACEHSVTMWFIEQRFHISAFTVLIVTAQQQPQPQQQNKHNCSWVETK